MLHFHIISRAAKSCRGHPWSRASLNVINHMMLNQGGKGHKADILTATVALLPQFGICTETYIVMVPEDCFLKNFSSSANYKFQFPSKMSFTSALSQHLMVNFNRVHSLYQKK